MIVKGCLLDLYSLSEEQKIGLKLRVKDQRLECAYCIPREFGKMYEMGRGTLYGPFVV